MFGFITKLVGLGGIPPLDRLTDAVLTVEVGYLVLIEIFFTVDTG